MCRTIKLNVLPVPRELVKIIISRQRNTVKLCYLLQKPNSSHHVLQLQSIRQNKNGKEEHLQFPLYWRVFKDMEFILINNKYPASSIGDQKSLLLPLDSLLLFWRPLPRFQSGCPNNSLPIETPGWRETPSEKCRAQEHNIMAQALGSNADRIIRSPVH